METTEKLEVRVADEVWIATALLHRENPQREDFTIEEILTRAATENLHEGIRPGVRVHAQQHCVANRPANPGRYRMLFATGKSRRRLFRPGDLYHPSRRAAKVTPKPEEIPVKYHFLLAWYEKKYADSSKAKALVNSILALRGLGKELWGNTDPDEYIRQLREGWE